MADTTQLLKEKQSNHGIRLKSLSGGLIPVCLMGIILFASSGRPDWTAAWILLVVHVAGTVFAVAFSSISLLESRSKKDGTKAWDKTLMPLMSIIGLIALVVAGLDQRFGWSPDVPLFAMAGALILLILGYVILDWAMVANKFFSATVRINVDREQEAATGGPYRFIRHPGYVGLILCVLAQPLLLGSLWAYLPALLTAGILLVRTGLEDRDLREELNGYKDYAERVRYRLLPGVW